MKVGTAEDFADVSDGARVERMTGLTETVGEDEEMITNVDDEHGTEI
jgi:hypothetical protein